LIQGMHFKVVVGEDILDIIEEFEGENDQSDDEYETRNDQEEEGKEKEKDKVQNKEKESLKRTATRPQPLKSNTKVVSKSESIQKSQSKKQSVKESQQKQETEHSPGEVEGEAEADVDLESVESIVFDKKTGQSLRKAYTMLPLRSASRGVIHRVGEVGLDHIKLDRAWLFDDIEYVNVHRVSKKPSYAQPFFEVSEASSLLLHLRIVSSSSLCSWRESCMAVGSPNTL
jgi:hypothetical protein